MLEITSIRVATFSIDSLTISWEIATTSELVTNYKFDIYRSGSESGSWDKVNIIDLTDVYEYTDGTPNLFAANRDYFYKVRVVSLIDNSYSESSVARLEFKPSKIAMDIGRRNRLVLEKKKGTLCYLFKKRRVGTRCSCYNEDLQKSEDSSCLSCYGTTFVGGYFRPIRVYLEIIESNKPLTRSDFGDVEIQLATALAANHPVIMVRDIIVAQTNRRYRVQAVEFSTKLGYITSQRLSLNRLELSAIEYNLPILESSYPAYYAEKWAYLPKYDT